jgi:hypothetical protein
MAKLMKWKNSIFLCVTIWILGLAFYGVYHSITKYNELKQIQSGLNSVREASETSNELLPGGTLCSYYGCSGCGGCVFSQYQVTETAAANTVSIEAF